MSPNCARIPRCLLAGVALSLALVAAGCGESRHSVDGRLLLNGAPLNGKEGAVVLKPDASKGNTSTAAAAGTLRPDGSFSIQGGCTPGWYKAIVLATEPGANPNDDVRRVLPARYETEAATPLAIEVVADPSSG